MDAHVLARQWSAAPLAALAMMAAGPAAAQLAVTGFGVAVEAGDAAVPTIKTDPLFAELNVGNSFAQADLLAGTLKASTFVVGTDAQLARASSFVGFRNDGLAPFPVLAGTISAHLTATFAHSIGTPPPGMPVGFGNQLISTLFVGPTPITVADITYSHGGEGNTESFIVGPSAIGGAMTIVNVGTRSQLDVDFEMGAFTIAPGEIFDIQAFLSAVAIATGPASAFVDAATTFQLAMVLPVGVTLDSPVALAWVTTAVPAVPEPETYALLLGGLGFVAWVTKRRRQRV